MRTHSRGPSASFPYCTSIKRKWELGELMLANCLWNDPLEPGLGSELYLAYFNYSELRVLCRVRELLLAPRAGNSEPPVFRIGRRVDLRFHLGCDATSLSPSEIRWDCDSRKSHIRAWLTIRVWNPSTREIDNACAAYDLRYRATWDWMGALLLWFVVSYGCRLEWRTIIV